LNQNTEEPAGTVLGLIDQGLAVSTQNGILLIDELQMEGKKRMSAQAFYQGVGKQWLKRQFDRYEN
jgi:methionyl-tRNA formyltransferase